MVFSSALFLFFFLPVCFLFYFSTSYTQVRNWVLIIFSLIFYGWGEPWFVLVLAVSVMLNWTAAIYIDQEERRGRLVAVVVTVTLNLLLLASFKYGDFIVENLNVILLPTLGLSVPQPGLPLPLGISFFTFHCLSYVIDVYRRRFRANRRPSEIALYIVLFPQLVAGPIVRYKTIARQLRWRRHTMGRASIGTRIFIIGLAQKILIADQVASLVETIFDHTPAPSMLESWTGLLAYTVQIYFDFCGYSNMAVGLGFILGFSLPRNFRLPYTAVSVTDFWRRWHISLSSWLRDYLYIPLGGSRGSSAQVYRNLILVFLLCGLWHGSSWTFVLWGAWHGAFLVIERMGLRRLLGLLPVALRWAYTILVVMGGWVLFRAHDVGGAGAMYAGLLGWNGIGDVRFQVHLALEPSVILALAAGWTFATVPAWTPALRRWAVPGLARLRAATDTVWIFGLLIFSLLYAAAGTYSPFLYFRF
ncbi:MBOAT family protein [Roseomonas sp. OT10]|uniref:MBOAT family O-acyltransferase n=1 Tax=Roseomonas cutis TaxID=2897332 RepID=UPI001E5FBFC1|nr:MBOAT family O-acyltransferase [Roseomonas sp. OT10]UFN50969.1 MBOAT family protein [Roseomonas sp. OT10]